MMRAAAVLMYRPSPSGFFGIGELGKFTVGAGGFGRLFEAPTAEGGTGSDEDMACTNN
jgi:hypothetical protein